MAICLVGIISANAASNDPIEKNSTLTSLGVVSGEMMFNLKCENLNGDKVEVVLTDSQGTRLYRQIYTDKNLNKTFRVPVDVEKLVVRVTNLKDKTQQKFEVTTQRRTIEDVIVKSLN